MTVQQAREVTWSWSDPTWSVRVTPEGIHDSGSVILWQVHATQYNFIHHIPYDWISIAQVYDPSGPLVAFEERRLHPGTRDNRGCLFDPQQGASFSIPSTPSPDLLPFVLLNRLTYFTVSYFCPSVLRCFGEKQLHYELSS